MNGVTFLAFGNGAPDFFSAISALSDEGSSELGVGGLFGECDVQAYSLIYTIHGDLMKGWRRWIRHFDYFNHVYQKNIIKDINYTLDECALLKKLSFWLESFCIIPVLL